MPPNIDPFAAFFGVNAQIHIEDASITQINGTLDERVDVVERILENTGNVHNIRFREKTLEYTTSDRRENRGSRGRNSSTEPPGTSASENSGSGADESEDEGEGPPRVPSEAVTRAPYQQPTLPFAPPRKYQSDQSNREANYLALVNASAAMDMQAQREQRASNRGALLPSALMSLGTPGLIPNMIPGMPGIGGPVGIPGNAYAQMPYYPGMNSRSTNISTSYAIQNPNGTTTATTTSISGSGMGLPVVGRGLLEVHGVPTLKGHVVETKRIETTEAKRSGNVLNATYTTTKKTTQKYAYD